MMSKLRITATITATIAQTIGLFCDWFIERHS
jgi:hypothetical protein